MKEINCKDNQILNPATKRCINRDTKKAIEILFRMNDENIHKIYESVNGQIIKRCEDGKIRNPETNRCVNKVNKTKKAVKPSLIKTDVIKKLVTSVIPESLRNKIDAIKKAKKALSPFINRVSADVYHRNKYLVLMKRELKDKKNGCLKVYKENPDGTILYRIGNRIIFKKRIGTDSKNGIVFLSEFREKEKKLFTFASKIYIFEKKTKNIEIPILEKLTNLVRMDVCPHFPILYGYVLCLRHDNNRFFGMFKKKTAMKDSFVKSDPKDKTIIQKEDKLPAFVKKNNNEILITSFNELANGDLWSFFRLYEKNEVYLLNALVQQLLSIMFFHYHIKRIHNDAHPGNFLYHKIKPGGYFHYNLFGVDYYLENLGFLWVIWDFDYSIDMTTAINTYIAFKVVPNDYIRICNAYATNCYGRCGNEFNKHIELKNFSVSLINWSNKYFSNGFGEKKLNDYINFIPMKMSSLKNILLTSIPVNAKIINNEAYKIKKGDIF